MKSLALALALVAGLAAIALSACSSGTTLHGTFTETMNGDPTSKASCASQEFNNDPSTTWKVRVDADNVDVGTAPVQWTGSPYHTSMCMASWSMSVPPAQEAYQVTLIAVCDDVVYNDYGTENIDGVTVQPSQAGQPIALSDNSAGGSNC